MRLRLSIVALCLLWSASAHASSDEEFRYSLDAVWNSMIRLVRVDLNLEIVDRDRDAGYLMFRYRDGERFYPANFEVVERKEAGLVGVRATIEGMPSYLERVLLDKLTRKLKQEYGEPIQKRPEPPAVKDKPQKPVEPKEPNEPDDEPNDAAR